MAGRTAAKVEKVTDSIRAANGSATAVTVDGTKEAEVIARGILPAHIHEHAAVRQEP
jgi:hypothetical protein